MMASEDDAESLQPKARREDAQETRPEERA